MPFSFFVVTLMFCEIRRSPNTQNSSSMMDHDEAATANITMGDSKEALDVQEECKVLGESVEEREDEVVVVETRMPTTTNVATFIRRRDEDASDLLQAFQHQQHSLRISASNVAAMAGFHPWKNLPDLLMNLVYQGRWGQALLRRDAELLGLTLASEDEILLELAAKAGTEVRHALQSALQVKQGVKKVDSVETAAQLKAKVVQEAKKTGKLKVDELRVLQEGARSAVDTGYGTAHEDGALDLYEQQCGWDVRERNAEIREWPFARQEDVLSAGNAEESAIANGPLTVIPLHNATAYWRQPEEVQSTNELASSNPKRQRFEDSTSESTSSTTDDVAESGIRDTSDVPENDLEASAEAAGSGCAKTAEEEEERENPPPIPFFSIMGSVDGIREELAPCSTETSFSPSQDDSWMLRAIIVECKHRMKRIHAVPPLYEQIQTAAYCLMYEVTEADIVQVMRRQPPKKKTPYKPESPKKQGSLDSWIQRDESSSKDNENPTPSDNPKPENETKAENEPKLEPVISVTRVSLDDPIMQHRKHWTETILPRLRLFVQAVYTVRSNDDKRYRLLTSVSDSTGTMEEAWQILFHECPFLQSCDTAYHRRT